MKAFLLAIYNYERTIYLYFIMKWDFFPFFQRESMNTVYFSEDMQEAAEAVSQTIHMYEKLLNELDENQKKDVVRTIGLKMAELKAQQAAMEEELKSD